MPCGRASAPHAGRASRVVLGSGWGALDRQVTEAQRIPYAALPGFPAPAWPATRASCGWAGSATREVAVLSGRKHAYEDGDAAGMTVPLRSLRALGCELLVQTNAAGSLHSRMPPGSLMLINDHLNLAQRSPLVGEVGAARFVDMLDAYDAELRATALAVAARNGDDAARRRLCLVPGAAVRDAGRDPHAPAARRRCGGHEHRA